MYTHTVVYIYIYISEGIFKEDHDKNCYTVLLTKVKQLSKLVLFNFPNEQRLDDQLEPINNYSVLIQDVAWKTCRERWTIETNDKRGSGRSVLTARHDDDDDDDKRLEQMQCLMLEYIL